MEDFFEEFEDLELQDVAPSAELQQQLQEEKRRGKQPVIPDASESAGSESEDEGDAVASAPPSHTKSAAASEPGDLTCAICLGDINLEDLAMVKGCDHIYCAKCILLWALHKESPWCPQCKQPFTHLFTYRTLDGQLQDFPAEESVVLLKRARWFEDSLRDCDMGRAVLEDSRTADDIAWQDYADDFDLADDEAIEAFYFSSAAGRARVTVGNRRFGEGGFISTGRRQARPAQPPRRTSKGKAAGGGTQQAAAAPGDVGHSGAGPSRRVLKGGGSGKGGRSGEHAVVAAGSASASVAVPIRTPNANGGRKSMAVSPAQAADLTGMSPGGSKLVYGSSPSGTGRRARRNARRQATVQVADAG